MESLEFKYEISVEEFVSAQLLLLKLQGKKSTRRGAALVIVFGVVLMIIAANATVPEWTNGSASVGLTILLLALVGLFMILAGFRALLFRTAGLRRSYRISGFAGKTFSAFANQTGFQVNDEYRRWSMDWPGVESKAEDKAAFIFVSGGMIFIFGKKYLTNEQQEVLRRLSGL